MGQRIFSILQKIITLSLSAALVLSSVNAAEAISLGGLSAGGFNTTYLNFLRNQERMRVETQALSARMVDCGIELGLHPFAGRLLGRYRSLVIPDFEAIAFMKWLGSPVVSTFLFDFLSWGFAIICTRDASDAVATGFLYMTSLRIFNTGLRYLFSSGPPLSPSTAGCGNLLYSGKLSVDQLMELLRPSLIDLLNRGNYSFGYSFMIPVKRKVPSRAQIPGFEEKNETLVWEYRIKKVWVPKRTAAVELAMASIRKEIEKAYAQMQAAHIPIPETMMFSFHSRLGTTGTHGESVQDLEEAAQPGVTPPEGQPEDWELRWIPEIGAHGHARMVPKYVLVTHVFQFNGDISGTKAIHEKQAGQHATGNTDARIRFGRWLGYPVSTNEDAPRRGVAAYVRYGFAVPSRLFNHLRSIRRGSGKIAPGDAPLEALQLKMFNTERLWYASIRYALFNYVIAPTDPRDANPPFELMKKWHVLFERGFQAWAARQPGIAEEWLKKPKTQAEADVIQAQMAERAKNFAAYLEAWPEMAGAVSAYLPTQEERKKLFENASVAFWRNTLPYAVEEEMKPRMEGTEALDASTTLNPPDGDASRVETALGQNLVVGLSKDGKVICIVSDRMVLPHMMVTHRVRVESHRNTSVVIGTRPNQLVTMMLTRGVGNTVISEKEIRAELTQPMQSRNGNGHLPEMPESDGILELSIRNAAVQIPRVHDYWKPVHEGLPAANLTPAIELTRVLMQRPIYLVLLAYLHSNGLPVDDMDAWAWSEAERLSRDMWSKKKSEADVLQEIASLARAERLRVHPGSPDPYRITIPKDRSVAAVIIATGKTKLAAEKFARSIYRSAGLKIVVYNGNEMIKLTNKHGEDVDGFLHEVGVDRHTPMILATDSGAETYEPNILKAYLPFAAEEIFGIGGTDDSQLVDAFGAERVITTYNDGSKSQDGLTAYGSMVQTFEELSLFISENVTARFATGAAQWRNDPFFKTPFTHDQILHILRPANDDLATHIPQSLLGYTAKGERLETRARSNKSADLRIEGLKRAERQQELSRKTVAAWTYALLMIVFAGSGFGVLSLELIPRVFPSIVHNPMLAAPVTRIALTIIARLIDAVVDCAFSLALLLSKRWLFLRWGWSDTKVFEGFGLPAFLFVSPFPWVHDALVDIARAAQGLAYTITKSYFDASLNSEVNDDHRATPNRNSVAIIFRPGHDFNAEKFTNEEADQIGRHLKTQASLTLPDGLVWLAKLIPSIRPTPPRVIDAGTAKPVKRTDSWGKMAFTSEVKTEASKLIVHFTGKKAVDVPDHVVEYWLEQYESFTWFLLYTRVLYSQLHRVAQGILGGLFRYPEGRFFGGGAVKSTQASAPGTQTLLIAERLAQTVPMRLIPIGVIKKAGDQAVEPSLVNIETAAVWKAWPRAAYWLPNEPAHVEIQQPAPRPLTVPVEPVSYVSSIVHLAVAVESQSMAEEKTPEPAMISRVVIPIDEMTRRAKERTRIRRGLRKTMVVRKRVEPSAVHSLEGSLLIEPDGRISYRSESLPVEFEKLAAQAIQAMDLAGAIQASKVPGQLQIVVTPLTTRPAFFDWGIPLDPNAPIRGILYIDSHLVQDLMEMSTAKEIAPARATYLVLINELIRARMDFNGESDILEADTPSDRQLELDEIVTNLTLDFFLRESKTTQARIITYWKQHAVYDDETEGADAPLLYWRDILTPLSNAYDALTKRSMRNEELKHQARVQVIDELKDKIADYVEAVAQESAPDLAEDEAAPEPVHLIPVAQQIQATPNGFKLFLRMVSRSSMRWIGLILVFFASLISVGDHSDAGASLMRSNIPKTQAPPESNAIASSSKPAPLAAPAAVYEAEPQIPITAPAAPTRSKIDMTNLKRIVDAAKPQSALSLLEELSKQPDAAPDVRSTLASYRNVAQTLMAFKIALDAYALESQPAKSDLDKFRQAAKELTHALGKLPAPLNTLKGQLQRGFPERDKDIEDGLFEDDKIAAVKEALEPALLARLNAPGFNFANVILGFLGVPPARRRGQRATSRTLLASA